MDNLLANSVLDPINFSATIPHGDGKGPLLPNGQEKVIYLEKI